MKSSARKPYVITGTLFIYSIVMAVINRDTLTQYHDYTRYFGTIALQLVVLVLLFIFLRRREALRRRREEEEARLAEKNKKD